MSTSDPDRPADDTTAPVDGKATPDAPVTPETPETEVSAAASAEPPAGEPVGEPQVVEPGAEAPVEPAVDNPVSAEPAVEHPGTTEPVVRAKAEPMVAPAVTPEPVSLDTGRHAVVRPAPVPPDDPTPVVAPVAPVAPVAAGTSYPTTTVEPATAAVAAASVEAAPVPEPAYGAITPEPDVDGRLFPDPSAPSSPSAGSRVLGIIVGLILTPIAVGVLLLGESQILEQQVDGWDASTSVFGIVLVTLGLLLLGCVLLLGSWTAAVPITGGALLTVAGVVYLYAPSIAREQTLHLLTSSGWRLTITQVTVAGTSGMVLAVGFLLLLAGIVIASARRRGVRLGEFRERHKL